MFDKYWDTEAVPCSDSPSGPITRKRVDSSKEDKSGDVNLNMDLESVVSSEEGVDDSMTRGMWLYPTSLDHCCIYRVPNRLRDVNPKAYTPQLLLIGPLNLSLKEQGYAFRKDGNTTKARGYVNMENHKKIYLKAFRQRVKDENVINEFKRVIKEDEEMIRDSYSESTTWIQSQDFVEMILHDSVFILEFILRSSENNNGKDGKKIGDVLMDEPMVKNTVHEDLILLENQLPYSILQKLFDPIVPKLPPHRTFRNLIIEYFRFKNKIKDDTEFKHFADLFRCVRVETLNLKEEINATREDKIKDDTGFKHFTHLLRCVRVETLNLKEEVEATREDNAIESMYNVEKLDDAGVKFEAIDDNLFSLEVRFEKGCLKLPRFRVDDSVEMILRNIMALEQCHYPYQAYVCSFVIFLDHLINTHKDVDILVGKGIINNWMGYHGYVARMVNKLSLGIVDFNSIYYNIATQVNAYYDNPINRARAILKRGYFSNPWTGTATVAAVFLLLMTLIQTVISFMQVMQK